MSRGCTSITKFIKALREIVTRELFSSVFSITKSQLYFLTHKEHIEFVTAGAVKNTCAKPFLTGFVS
jgi:hypothetical protein